MDYEFAFYMYGFFVWNKKKFKTIDQQIFYFDVTCIGSIEFDTHKWMNKNVNFI